MWSPQQFPMNLWDFETGRSDFDVTVEWVLKVNGVKATEDEILDLIKAIQENTISLLPDWFQWRRHNDPDIVTLYTTRKSEKVKTW